MIKAQQKGQKTEVDGVIKNLQHEVQIEQWNMKIRSSIQSISAKRPKLTINPIKRNMFEDMVTYSLSSTSGDPSTFPEAISSSERERGMEAMVEEMESLKKNKTWVQVGV